MIVASGNIGVKMMMDLGQRILDGKECLMNGKLVLLHLSLKERVL